MTDPEPPQRFREAAGEAHDRATAIADSTDFGPTDYLPGLRMLLRSMDYDPHFTEHGRRVAWSRVVDALAGRAHAYRSMAEHPGFERTAIAAPVVITGIPRTGTTALHRLLACDTRFQGLQSWLLDAPMPRPAADTWTSHPQFLRSARLIEAHYAASPDARTAHQRAAEEVHECCMLLRQSFVSNVLSCGWSAASYDAWWQAQDEAPAYAHYRRCVQLIGSGEPEKRWLLKNPGHIEHLDLLFAVFPDARVIQTHRDPAAAVTSLVSLLMKAHPLMEEGRQRQRGEIMLAREVAKWARAVGKAAAVRARFPGQVLDVVHADYHRDPMREIERVYAFIGWDIPAGTRAAFAERTAARPEQRFGEHRYDIADFGMTAEEARAPFGDYVREFELAEARA